MRTFYCLHPSCTHHVDVWIEPPQRCPTCGRESYWGTEPPPLDACLTEDDKQFLKGPLIQAEREDDGA